MLYYNVLTTPFFLLLVVYIQLYINNIIQSILLQYHLVICMHIAQVNFHNGRLSELGSKNSSTMKMKYRKSPSIFKRFYKINKFHGTVINIRNIYIAQLYRHRDNSGDIFCTRNVTQHRPNIYKLHSPYIYPKIPTRIKCFII